MTVKSFISDGDKVYKLEKIKLEKARKLPKGHKGYSRKTRTGKVSQVKEKPYVKKETREQRLERKLNSATEAGDLRVAAYYKDKLEKLREKNPKKEKPYAKKEKDDIVYEDKHYKVIIKHFPQNDFPKYRFYLQDKLEGKSGYGADFGTKEEAKKYSIEFVEKNLKPKNKNFVSRKTSNLSKKVFKDGERVRLPADKKEGLAEEYGTVLGGEQENYKGMYTVSLDKKYSHGPDDDLIREVNINEMEKI